MDGGKDKVALTVIRTTDLWITDALEVPRFSVEIYVLMNHLTSLISGLREVQTAVK
jgi:hypothetical protein